MDEIEQIDETSSFVMIVAMSSDERWLMFVVVVMTSSVFGLCLWCGGCDVIMVVTELDLENGSRKEFGMGRG